MSSSIHILQTHNYTHIQLYTFSCSLTYLHIDNYTFNNMMNIDNYSYNIYIYIYIYIYLPVKVIAILPHHRSGDSQRQETFLAPSADK